MKKTKKRELKEGFKNIFNIIILLSNYYVISTMMDAVQYFANEGIYGIRFLMYIAITLTSSSILLKRINFTRK